jgi:hypothetical protein
VHAFSLTTITGGLTAAERTCAYVWVSVSWLLIHVVFELGQGPARRLVELTPAWVDQVPFLSNVRHYFLLGTFDEADLVAAFFGCACAFGVLMLTRHRKGRNP